MRKKKGSARIAPLVVLGAVAVAAAAAAQSKEGAAGVDARWVTAMKANDVGGVVACYAPDAVAWLPAAPEARGIEAIRNGYAGLLGENTVVDAVITGSQYAGSGDVSAGWGTFTLTLKSKKTGETQVLKGRFVEVAKKTGGKWLYVADHASLEPPPPAPKS